MTLILGANPLEAREVTIADIEAGTRILAYWAEEILPDTKPGPRLEASLYFIKERDRTSIPFPFRKTAGGLK